MPEAQANGINLHYELQGSGEPLVLVHGSWGDASNWSLVAGPLAESFQVLAYDRRGHSRSERPPGQGSVDQHGDDLAALLEALDLAPAHVVTNSFGGNIAARLALRRPEVFRSLTSHEPPLWGILPQGDIGAQTELAKDGRVLGQVSDLIALGRPEEAARMFVDEVAFGPGAWEDELPPRTREMFVRNAPTFLDDFRDPTMVSIDEAGLRELSVPVRLTAGTESYENYRRVVDRMAELIPGATRDTFEGAGHVPHLSMPEQWVEATVRALTQQAPGTGSPAGS